MIHMPNMNLSAWRSVDDRAPLQVAHFQPSKSSISPNVICQVAPWGLTAQCRVGLWSVHAKLELIVGTQMAGYRDCRDILGRIVDDQRIRLGQQGRRTRCFRLCVPHYLTRRLEGGIAGYWIFCVIRTAGDVDIDLVRLDRERGIVPSKCHIVSDLIV